MQVILPADILLLDVGDIITVADNPAKVIVIRLDGELPNVLHLAVIADGIQVGTSGTHLVRDRHPQFRRRPQGNRRQQVERLAHPGPGRFQGIAVID